MKNSSNVSWYVPLHRDQLMSVIAGGSLPRKTELLNEQEDGLQKGLSSAVFAVQGGIPESILSNSDICGESGYFVLAELDERVFSDCQKFAFDEVVGWKTDPRSNEVSSLALLSCSVNLVHMGKIHFRTESDKSGFLSRPFENIPFDCADYYVSPDLFLVDAHKENLIMEAIKSFPLNLQGQDDEIYDLTDKTLGALVALIGSNPETRSWAEFIADGLSDGIYVAINKSKIFATEFEKNCFEQAFSYFSSCNPSDGWQSKNILLDLYQRMEKVAPSDRELSMLIKWKDRCGEILDNKSVVTPLTDEKFIVGRALLLLLLRPELDAVLDSRGSSLSPGPIVRTMAATLSGSRVGLEELPNQNKVSSREQYHALLSCAFWLSNKNQSIASNTVLPPVIAISEVDSGGLMVLHSLTVDGISLLGVHEGGPHELQVVYNHAYGAGISLRFNRASNSLSFTKEFHDTGRKQHVFITPGAPNQEGMSTVRFWSRCMDLTSASARAKLTKKLALEILERNCDPDLHCRFALCEKSEMILVLKDQIVKTIDEAELTSALEQVAKAADDFEREKTGGADKF